MRTSLNISRGVFEAARQRVTVERTPVDVDKTALSYLKRLDIGFPPPIRTDLALSAINYLDYLRDVQFLIQSGLSQTKQLKKAIKTLVHTNNALFSTVENNIVSIQSTLTEKEIKLQDSWDYVRFNTFSKSEDMSTKNRSFFYDPKTNLSLLDENEIVPSRGHISLPIKTQEIIKPMQCQIVSDETDFGDTTKPFLITNPYDCFTKDSVFRFLTLRRLYSSSTQRLLNDGARLSLLIDFGIAQKFNSIEIKPASCSVFRIETIEFYNQSDELIEVQSVNQQITSSFVYLVDVVNARYVKIKFFQQATVAIGEFVSKDDLKSYLSKAMEGAGFITGLDNTEETLEGFIYDFSIRSIVFKLTVYERLGGFIGQPIQAKPIGIDMVLATDSLTSIDSINTPQILDQSFNEAWVGLKSQKYQSVFPIPSKELFEEEKLELIGPNGPLRFFPDLRYGVVKTRILRSVPGSGIVTLTLEDNISVGSVAGVWGSFGHDLNGYFPVVSQVTTTVVLTATGSNLALTPNTTPYFYIYNTATAYEPFEIFRDNTLLTVGVDYEYSLDAGETWLSDFNVSGDINRYFRNPIAGNFRIRFLINIANGIYWCSYRKLSDQLLTRDSNVFLKSGVLHLKSLEKLSIFPIIIMRSNSDSPYLTSLVTDYSLRVRTNVS